MTWREVLEKAASVDPSAESQVGAVVAAIEEGLAGAPTEAAVRAMLGGRGIDDAGVAPLVAALDRAARAGQARWDEDTLAAVRAVLLHLDDALNAIVQLHLRVGSAGSLPAALERMARAAGPERPVPGGGPSCPRCGYSPIESRRDKALGDVLEVIRCPACGFYSETVTEKRDERFPKF